MHLSLCTAAAVTIMTAVCPCCLAESYEEYYWREIGFNLQLFLTAMAILAVIICLLSSAILAFCYWHAKQRDFTITPTLSFLNLNLMPPPPSGNLQQVVNNFVHKHERKHSVNKRISEVSEHNDDDDGDDGDDGGSADTHGTPITLKIDTDKAVHNNNNSIMSSSNSNNNNNNHNINNMMSSNNNHSSNSNSSSNSDMKNTSSSSNTIKDNSNNNINSHISSSSTQPTSTCSVDSDSGVLDLRCIPSSMMQAHQRAELMSEYDCLCDYVERPNIFATMESLSSVVVSRN